MISNFVEMILPIFYLHDEEPFKPLLPDEYLSNVFLYRDSTNELLEEKVSLEILKKYTDSSDYSLRSKHKDPKQFWAKYYYKDINTVPLFYTEEIKHVQSADGVIDSYIERNFNIFYGYNSAYIFGIGDHEADIEDFVIHYSMDGSIIRIYAGCHGTVDGEWRHAKDVHIDYATKRPILFIAKGSHGIYFEPKKYFRFYCFANDENDSGIRWTPVLAIKLDPIKEKWLDYQGSWGNGHVGSPNKNVDPEIYWVSNNDSRRFFGCGSLTQFDTKNV